MKLHVTKRSKEQKKEAKRLRRDGKIPAVVYKGGDPSEMLTVSDREFKEHLRKISKGHLPTSIFTLVDEEGKEVKAIVKEIQYHVTTYASLHLDFVELVEDVPVNIKVPIECVNAVDCIGVKQGGVLRVVMRHVSVCCLPKEIPDSFTVNVADLEVMHSKRLRHVDIPKTVRILADIDDVAVIVAKR